MVRTFNSPIGDIAEELVALHYGGERSSFSQKTWDVRVGTKLLQVKSLRRNEGGKRRNLSPIRSDDGYDAVIVVVSRKTYGSRKQSASPAQSSTRYSSGDPT